MGIKLVVFTFETALNILLIIVNIKDPLKIFKGSSSSFILNIAFVYILVCVLGIIKITLDTTSPGYRINRETGAVLICVWIATASISERTNLLEN